MRQQTAPTRLSVPIALQAAVAQLPTADFLEGRLVAALPTDRSLCHEGLHGVFCRTCERRNVSVYYAAATSRERARCPECRESAQDTFLIATGFLVAMIAAGLVLVYLHRRFTSAQHKEQLSASWSKCTPYVKLKILIGFVRFSTLEPGPHWRT